MTAERLAEIRRVRSGRQVLRVAALCYSCNAILARRAANVHLANGLVPRPEKHAATGLPRFGPSRRRGKPREADDRMAKVIQASGGIGNPGAIYVNCPNCDRGQVVRFD